MSRCLTRKLKAMIHGAACGLMIGCACVTFVVFSQTVLMGNIVPEAACGTPVSIMTTFTPDIRC